MYSLCMIITGSKIFLLDFPKRKFESLKNKQIANVSLKLLQQQLTLILIIDGPKNLLYCKCYRTWFTASTMFLLNCSFIKYNWFTLVGKSLSRGQHVIYQQYLPLQTNLISSEKVTWDLKSKIQVQYGGHWTEVGELK